MELKAKLELIEKLVKEVRMEIDMPSAENIQADSHDEELLCELKSRWDLGMRNTKSKTGRFFRASDICNLKCDNLANRLNAMVGKNNRDISINVGKALHMLSDKTFIQEGVKYVMKRYNVESTSAYRFVEIE